MEEAQRLYGTRDELSLCGTKEAALKGADALAVVTDWQAFKGPDFDFIKQRLSQPVVFDGRNMFEPTRIERRGITYSLIGRDQPNLSTSMDYRSEERRVGKEGVGTGRLRVAAVNSKKKKRK